MKRILRSPFPWFGSKQLVADLVWERFGQVDNYVEAFAGSLAVLLANPEPAKIETVNDTDCHLVNFFRAVARVPNEVASFVDYPVTEVDLQARHAWLVSAKATPQSIGERLILRRSSNGRLPMQSSPAFASLSAYRV